MTSWTTTDAAKALTTALAAFVVGSLLSALCGLLGVFFLRRAILAKVRSNEAQIADNEARIANNEARIDEHLQELEGRGWVTCPDCTDGQTDAVACETCDGVARLPRQVFVALLAGRIEQPPAGDHEARATWVRHELEKSGNRTDRRLVDEILIVLKHDARRSEGPCSI